MVGTAGGGRNESPCDVGGWADRTHKGQGSSAGRWSPPRSHGSPQAQALHRPHHKTPEPSSHSRFIVSNRAPAKLSQGAQPVAGGERGRGGQELGDAEVKAWAPALRVPSHLSGSKKHQFPWARPILGVVSCQVCPGQEGGSLESLG